jgi:hypothetical protein
MTIQKDGQARAIIRCKSIDPASQIADIIKHLNTIGENSLQRGEAANLRRAYASAVVRYFDERRITV